LPPPVKSKMSSPLVPARPLIVTVTVAVLPPAMV
jgi:hypothetical protein